MLEKNVKNEVFDAHFHYFDCKNLGILDFPENWMGISCAHTKEEWEIQKHSPDNIIHCYGMHPQNVQYENIEESYLFLQKLIENKEISAIGETGFDFYNKDCKSFSKLQEKIWNLQLELAVKNSLPLIVHCRKANEKLFEYAGQLKKVPEVLFHSFTGTSIEGKSLLKKGINGYFSFGKQVFNNNKKVIDCIMNLPGERVLGETDAPFQFLRGEEYTRPSEIVDILKRIRQLQK